MDAAERAYRDGVTQEYNALGFAGFGRAAPGPNQLRLNQVRLEDIFVRLHLTAEQDEPRQHGKPGADRAASEREKPITLAEALGKPLLLVGEPGAGKSTLLRWLAVTFAQGRQRDTDRIGPGADAGRLPILIELGHLPDDYLKDQGGKTPQWHTLLPEQILGQERFHDTPRALLQQALKAGRCLLLFDGLDEIANRRARVRLAQSLAQMPSLYSGNRVVVGSRPAGLTGESEGALRPTFQRCQMQRFTPEDLQRFFRFWYALDQKLAPEARQREADALYDQIKAAPGTLSLAGTPLLATMLLLLWRKESALPERRVDLYERCCQLLVEEWEQSHTIAYRGIFADLGWEQHLRLLAPLAYTIHNQEQRTSIGQDELQKLLKEGLQQEGLCTTPSAAGLEATRFLETLALRSGLLQFQGGGQYGLPHLTFQEYLAARHIAAQPDPGYINLVMEHLHDAWWQEVHLLTIGRLGSDQQGAAQAAALLWTILRRYRPPSRFLRLPPHWRRMDLGRWLPQAQLARRLAWLLRREEIFALWGAAECAPDGIPPVLLGDLAERAEALARSMLAEEARRPLLDAWLSAPGRQIPLQATRAIVHPLLAALGGADEDVRLAAARNLGQVGSGRPEVIQALLVALRDEDVREAAAMSLGRMGSGRPEVIQALLAALRDPDRGMREGAAMSLGRMGNGQPEVIQALLAALRDEDVRLVAAESLGRVGNSRPEVIQALLAALRDADEYMREAAAKSLGQVGNSQPEVIQALLAALRDADADVCQAAAKSLGRVGSGQPEVIHALLAALGAALRDPDRGMREAMAESLGQVGNSQPEVIQALLAALRDAGWTMREAAARSLGQVGSGRPEVIQALLAALRDADEWVRWTAATSLGQMKITNPGQLRLALVTLNRRLYAMDTSEREYALEAINRLVAGRALPGSRWKPVQSQEARVRRRRRTFRLAAAVLVLLALILGGFCLSGSPPFNSVFAGLSSAIGLIAGLAGLAGVTLRDLLRRDSGKKPE